MGFGVSIFFIALGAVLAFAVNVSSPGIDLNTVGVIFMLIGVIGLAVSALWWQDVLPWSRRTTYVRDYADDDVEDEAVHYRRGRPARRRRRVVEHRETHL